jgi:hypothetical protein
VPDLAELELRLKTKPMVTTEAIARRANDSENGRLSSSPASQDQHPLDIKVVYLNAGNSRSALK